MNQSINSNLSNSNNPSNPASTSKGEGAELLPGKQRIAFVQAGWHRDIVQQSYSSFCHTLAEHGLSSDHVERFDVPGSLEIPLQCQRLAATGEYAAIVAAGLIVDGGIYRHDFVATTVLDAMMRVQLDNDVPVLSLVLTPHHFSGSEEHQEFFHEHFKLKGAEAAHACAQTLQNQVALRTA